ncbi:ATP-binding cassette domain-containing protein [Demequina sp. SYSU T00192]|uniref:ATP-binding cassette domain-containing protein n=1 Tax=Demequina litoralis TaxID=3051660 RepID=A0ABT8G7L2_9MICO|nr:ATP-binding cassette domain-containing protein [Demequina sp. SYSU T00192]MDN4475136.1 ATP-binding cassette domain-containing protein [Demequina sp. SYSU T00192]
MIEVASLSKSYGSVRAVDDASFTVRPGVVTGFLGPNGAGKSTTMRMIMGLDRPTSGTALICGRPIAEHRAPLAVVGAHLDPRSFTPGRSARSHLSAVAASNGISRRRVDEVLELTGIASVARKRPKGFSLGMSQRLGLATALLGDPATLLLDEPVNGLDVDGVRWIRELARSLAAEGRAVLLSSHLMSEVEQTADHVVVIGRGRILADKPLSEFVSASDDGAVEIASTDDARLAQVLANAGASVAPLGGIAVSGLPASRIGQLAADAGVALTRVHEPSRSLEDAYLALTRDEVQYQSTPKESVK